MTSVPRRVAEVIREHVTLKVECIDLNIYRPRLPSGCGVVGFFRFHRGHTFAASALSASPEDTPLRRSFDKLDQAIEQQIQPQNLAA